MTNFRILSPMWLSKYMIPASGIVFFFCLFVCLFKHVSSIYMYYFTVIINMQEDIQAMQTKELQRKLNAYRVPIFQLIFCLQNVSTCHENINCAGGWSVSLFLSFVAKL